MHVTVTDKNGRTALCCPVLGGYCHPAEQFAMKFIAIFAEKYAFGTDLARMVAVTADDSKLWGSLTGNAKVMRATIQARRQAASSAAPAA